MIYITGDTHGQHDFWKLERFAESNPNLGKNDFLLKAGDFWWRLERGNPR